jgi:hypothetical protein
MPCGRHPPDCAKESPIALAEPQVSRVKSLGSSLSGSSLSGSSLSGSSLSGSSLWSGCLQHRSRLLQRRGLRPVASVTRRRRDVLKPGIKIGVGSFTFPPGAPDPSLCRSRRNAPPVSRVAAGRASLATLSDERQIEIPQFYRKSKATLANVQQACKKPRRSVRNIDANIAGKAPALRPGKGHSKGEACQTPLILLS